MDNLEELKTMISGLSQNDKVYEEITLLPEQQYYERGKPKKYLEATLDLFKAIEGKRIVELGCMRKLLRHPISELHPRCCTDGHSTYHWGTSGAEVISVDTSWKAVMVARWSCRKFKNVKIIPADAIEFLANFNHSIDLLFLDAWDVKPGIDYAEMHLLAYQKARPKLSRTNIISIDDTDIGEGGKARFLIPVLERDNYEILVRGRQTIAIS